MGGVGRRRIKRPLNHRSDLIILYGPRPSRAGLIHQAIDAIGDKAPAPFADGMFVDAELRRDRLTC